MSTFGVSSVAGVTAFLMGMIWVVLGILCVAGGGYEIVKKRRPPVPWFGRGYFPRNRAHRSDSWTTDEWRSNGIRMVIVGVVLIIGSFFWIT